MMEIVPGVYLSYPFCAQKCTYCNFASEVLPREMEQEYAEALIREIEAARFTWTPGTIYWGGGTPGSAPTDTLRTVMSRIPGHPWLEATIECAPGAVEVRRALNWAECGINRVSLGAQSFVRGELARTGRKHTAEIIASDVEMLRNAGLSNINIDLIAGLPGQTAASWRESLDWIARLAPPHVSVYMLEVDEDSRLGKEMLLGGVRYGASDVPGEEAIAGMYEAAVEHLTSMGVRRYEISNFARPGFESAHNLKYWRREPYLGFGSDAHSFDGHLRWQNVETAREYIRLSPRARGSETAANECEERFFVGLRLLEGLETSAEDWRRHGAALRRFLDGGLLEREGLRVRLTARGIMVSNDVLQEFLSA